MLRRPRQLPARRPRLHSPVLRPAHGRVRHPVLLDDDLHHHGLQQLAHPALSIDQQRHRAHWRGVLCDLGRPHGAQVAADRGEYRFGTELRGGDDLDGTVAGDG